MNRYGHLVFAFIVAIIFVVAMHYFYSWYEVSLKEVLFILVIMCIYALLPDIDSTSATITWVFIGFAIVGIGYSLITLNAIGIISFYALLVLTFMFAVFMKHRGFLHSIVFGVLISLPLLFFLTYQEVVLAFVCFYSHLVADGKFLKVI